MQIPENRSAILLQLWEPRTKGLEGGRGRGTVPGCPIILKSKSVGFTQTLYPVVFPPSGRDFRFSVPFSFAILPIRELTTITRALSASKGSTEVHIRSDPRTFTSTF